MAVLINRWRLASEIVSGALQDRAATLVGRQYGRARSEPAAPGEEDDSFADGAAAAGGTLGGPRPGPGRRRRVRRAALKLAIEHYLPSGRSIHAVTTRAIWRTGGVEPDVEVRAVHNADWASGDAPRPEAQAPRVNRGRFVRRGTLSAWPVDREDWNLAGFRGALRRSRHDPRP